MTTTLATLLPIRRAMPQKGHVVTPSFGDDPMPQSPDAERAILGSILINNHVWFRVDLTADDFFKDSHRTIYQIMALMVEERMEIEPLTLKAELIKHGLLDAVGGVEFVSSLLDMVPDIANVEKYGAIVKRMAKKRAGVTAGNKLMRDSMDPETEPEEVATAAMRLLSPVATREESQARPLAEVLSETCEAMESLRERGVGVAMTSGWQELDNHQIFVSTFAVTGAHTKMGKSALQLAWARSLARNDYPVVIFSLESSNRELSLRHASAMTGIPHSRVRDWRTFSDRDYDKMAQCRRDTNGLPIYLTRNIRTAEDIVLEIRRLKAMHGIRAAFIDYIQICDLRRRVDNREERLAEVSKLFLEAAIEQDVHVHAFSQLRDGAGEERRMTVSDLAYAKSIGKSARIVMLFNRPGKTDPNNGIPPCRVDFQIEAHNEGRTNDFVAHFDEVTQNLSDGTCEQNNCRTLRNAPIERRLI